MIFKRVHTSSGWYTALKELWDKFNSDNMPKTHDEFKADIQTICDRMAGWGRGASTSLKALKPFLESIPTSEQAAQYKEIEERAAAMAAERIAQKREQEAREQAAREAAITFEPIDDESDPESKDADSLASPALSTAEPTTELGSDNSETFTAVTLLDSDDESTTQFGSSIVDDIPETHPQPDLQKVSVGKLEDDDEADQQDASAAPRRESLADSMERIAEQLQAPPFDEEEYAATTAAPALQFSQDGLDSMTRGLAYITESNPTQTTTNDEPVNQGEYQPKDWLERWIGI